MALEIPGFELGIMDAAASLATKQYYCVKVTADHAVNICTSAGESFLGVLQETPAAGQAARVMITGVTKVVVGVGDLTAGQNWKTAADGTAIAAAVGSVSAGVVLIGATVGKLATVLLGSQTNAGGALAANGIVAAAAGKQMNGGVVTTSAGQASANTISIAHGLGTCVAVQIMALDAGNNVVTADADVTISGANIVVADGSTYNTVEGQKIHWIAFGTVA